MVVVTETALKVAATERVAAIFVFIIVNHSISLTQSYTERGFILDAPCRIAG